MSDASQPTLSVSVTLPRMDEIIVNFRKEGGEDFEPLYSIILPKLQPQMNLIDVVVVVLLAVIAFLEQHSGDPKFSSGRVGNLIPGLLRALMPTAKEYSPTDMIPAQVAILLQQIRLQLERQS